MVYKGTVTVNFYEESVVKQSEKEFIEAHRHHGLSDEELKQAYWLCVKSIKKKK